MESIGAIDYRAGASGRDGIGVSLAHPGSPENRIAAPDSMSTKRERISSVDTAWLRMDRPTNLMMIVGVMMFDAPIPLARLRRVIESRLLPYRRFRQRAVQDATGGYWEDDDYFDLDLHLQRTGLPAPGGKEELQHHVAELFGAPLDPAKPLWHFQLVENYDGGSALILRIHHSIADGIALIGVMLDLTDETADAPDARPDGAAEDEDADAESEPFLKQILQPLGEAIVNAAKASGDLWSKSVDLARNPGRIIDYARIGGGAAAEIAQLATMADDSPTRFKGRPGIAKRVAWSEPLPLAEIKAVGKVLDCSVNDILLSSVAGALRGYLLAKGDVVEGVEIRAMVPVNLRPNRREADPNKRLGNRFGLVAPLLPVGMENPLARLYEVKRRMEELKGSYQAALTLGILGVVGLCPKAVQQQILDLLAAKATAVMTNVPGPQKPLYMAGARLRQMMFWVPQSGDIGMGVSILSYDGQVQFGLVTDRRFVDDPQDIVSRFRPEFEKVLYAVLMEPWDERGAPQEIEAERAGPPRKRRKTAKSGAASPDTHSAAKPRVPKRFRSP